MYNTIILKLLAFLEVVLASLLQNLNMCLPIGSALNLPLVLARSVEIFWNFQLSEFYDLNRDGETKFKNDRRLKKQLQTDISTMLFPNIPFVRCMCQCSPCQRHVATIWYQLRITIGRNLLNCKQGLIILDIMVRLMQTNTLCNTPVAVDKFFQIDLFVCSKH